MAKSFSSYISDLEKPVKITAGVILGKPVHNLFDRLIEAIGTKKSDGTVKGLGFLGEETTKSFKKYLSPALVAGVGICANAKSKNDLIKNAGTGMTIYGVGSIGSELLFGKPIFAGTLGGGIFGSLIGDDDLEGDEDLDGDDDDLEGDDDEIGEVEGLGAYEEIAALPSHFDAPVAPAITRDAPWERETISGFSSII